MAESGDRAGLLRAENCLVLWRAWYLRYSCHHPRGFFCGGVVLADFHVSGVFNNVAGQSMDFQDGFNIMVRCKLV